jgi:hypothetical protein
MATSASLVPTSGGIVTITGNNFGVDTAVVTVLVGGAACDNLTITPYDSQLKCIAPAGTGNHKLIEIEVAGQCTADPIILSYERKFLFFSLPCNYVLILSFCSPTSDVNIHSTSCWWLDNNYWL